MSEKVPMDIFITALSLAGISVDAIIAALWGALSATDVSCGIAAVALTLTIISLLWDWEGFAWPEIYGENWRNIQDIDLNKYQVWTEEGTGRVYVYQYSTREEAMSEMSSWFCSRILFKWNKDKAMAEVHDMKGMAWARSTIKTSAYRAYAKQIRANCEKELRGANLENFVFTTEQIKKYLNK